MRRHAKAIVAISALLLFTLGMGAAAWAAAPTVTVDDATAVSYQSAHVSGTVDPQGQATTYRFEYASQADFSDAVAGPEGSLEGSGSQPVEGDLSGLSPGTTYHLRLIAENGDGSNEAVAASAFTTASAVQPTMDPVDDPGSFSAEVSGTVDPMGTSNVARFQYRQGTEGAWTDMERFNSSSDPELGYGTNPVHLVDELVGLKPSATYQVRLVDEAEGIATLISAPVTFTADPAAPSVGTRPGVSLSPTNARLLGLVNPNGQVASYYFEYGPTSSYGTTVPAGGASLATGSAFVPVAAEVGGLSPATTYHYRLVAQNATGVSFSDDREFTTSPSSGSACPNEDVRTQQRSQRLPDCRAFELVSPPDKNAGDIVAPLRPSRDGNSFAWISFTSYADAQGAALRVTYVGRRTPDGWVTKAFQPPAPPSVTGAGKNDLRTVIFDEDLTSMFFVTGSSFDSRDLDANPFTGFGGDDVFNVLEGAVVTRLSNGPAPSDSAEADVRLEAVSGDGSTVFMGSSEVGLTEDAPPVGRPEVYRWRGGELTFVGVDANGAPFTNGAVLGSGTPGNDSGGLPDSQAVSSDGSAFVYSSVQGNCSTCDPAQIYLHRDGVGNEQISLSQRTGSVGQPALSSASLIATTPGLQKIVFQSADRLTDDAPPGGGDYIYDVATGELEFSNPDQSGVFNIGVPLWNYWGIVAVSDDARSVYFQSPEVLAPGAKKRKRNLYLRHDGHVQLVATLAGGDPYGVTPITGQGSSPEYASGEATPDGTKLLFESAASLGATDTKGFTQIYLYDATRSRIDCVSCRASGGPSGAPATLAVDNEFGRIPSPRVISNDGKTVIFTSRDALISGDTNGKADAYLFENGKLSLLSTGTSADPSIIAGMSPDGSDVFFRTRTSLVPQDVDNGLLDLYDARVGGGFQVAEPPPECRGDACQGRASAPPPSSSVGSSQIGGTVVARKARCKAVRKTKRAAKASKAKQRQRRCAARRNGRNSPRKGGHR